MSIQISIGQVKRDISELVNRVTYAGERIILTSRGKPKAVLIGMRDYDRLLIHDAQAIDLHSWLEETRALSDKIEKRRGSQLDVDSLLRTARADLDER